MMSSTELGDGPSAARELLGPSSKQERTAHWTSVACHVARLLFLFSHGLLVMSVSMSLDNLAQASWWVVFMPAWIGDALCGVLVITSWFASCPYIRLCLVERQPRLGIHNPSILTEVLPDIVLSVLGFFVVVLIFIGEYVFCAYLDSVQKGQPVALGAAVVLLSIVALLSICHSACLLHNSALYGAVGGGLLGGVGTFAATSHSNSPVAKALALVPPLLAMAGLSISVVVRLLTTSRVLSREERLLRTAEILALVCLLAAMFSMVVKVGSALLVEARWDGLVAGVAMCSIAALRGRMYCLEIWRPIDERLLVQAASVPVEGVLRSPAEVQISLTGPTVSPS